MIVRKNLQEGYTSYVIPANRILESQIEFVISLH
jgi:hypothetical protein